MTQLKRRAALVLMGAMLAFASMPALAGGSSLPLIPKPVQVERMPGSFAPGEALDILLPAGAGDDWVRTARIFAEKAEERLGVPVRVRESEAAPSAYKGAILVGKLISANGLEGRLPSGDYPGEEGCKLLVDRDVVLVQVWSSHGFHNALMTLLQLIDRSGPSPVIPAVAVLDYPRFGWRGMLLDPARSFLPPDVIKKYIDIYSELKLNVLHWHLVDDQGWRIESKVFPRLHEVGGVLSTLPDQKLRSLDRNGWGRDNRGYYTRDEIREIVAYAADRHVMVVPEIDIPGHSSAMLSAYPELSCSGEPAPVRKGIGIFRTALCPGKENVYEFLDALFAEMATLFPSPYVHIGSDEVMASDWMSAPVNQKLIAEYGCTDNAGLQSYFVERVNDILKSHGKTMIGWDEITSYLPEGSVVQAWRRHDFARAAAEAGHDAIVSPVTHCYIDYPQLTFTLKNLYGFEPIPKGLPPELVPRILGAEVNMWGERVTLDNLDRKTFPRLLAHAEVTWSPAELRDWNDFLARLTPVKRDMIKRGVGFGRTWRDLLLFPAFAIH